MNARAPTSAATNPHAPASGSCGGDAALARRERQLRALDRVIEISVELVEHLRVRVLRGPLPSAVALTPAMEPAFHAGLSLAFSRAARAVRLTVALQARLMNEPDAPPDAGAPPPTAPPQDPPPVRVQENSPAPQRPEREAGDQDDEAEPGDKSPAERRERDVPDSHIMARPVAEILDQICRDSVLSPAEAQAARRPFEDQADGQAAASPNNASDAPNQAPQEANRSPRDAAPDWRWQPRLGDFGPDPPEGPS